MVPLQNIVGLFYIVFVRYNIFLLPFKSRSICAGNSYILCYAPYLNGIRCKNIINICFIQCLYICAPFIIIIHRKTIVVFIK